MRLTTAQQVELLKLVTDALKEQKGLIYRYDELNVLVRKPNATSMCSFVFHSTRTDDNFKVKLYLRGFGNYSVVENFTVGQESSYMPGYRDEVLIADVTLEEAYFMSFKRYVVSEVFQAEVVDFDYSIKLETGGNLLNEDALVLGSDGKMVTSNNRGILMYEN